jgi:hypothetical protein
MGQLFSPPKRGSRELLTVVTRRGRTRAEDVNFPQCYAASSMPLSGRRTEDETDATHIVNHRWLMRFVQTIQQEFRDVVTRLSGEAPATSSQVPAAAVQPSAPAPADAPIRS